MNAKLIAMLTVWLGATLLSLAAAARIEVHLPDNADPAEVATLGMIALSEDSEVLFEQTATVVEPGIARFASEAVPDRTELLGFFSRGQRGMVGAVWWPRSDGKPLLVELKDRCPDRCDGAGGTARSWFEGWIDDADDGYWELASLADAFEKRGRPARKPARAGRSEGEWVWTPGQGGLRLIPESKVEPPFPEKARRERVGGIVLLKIRIETDGSVSDIKVDRCTKPGYGFEQKAIEAVSQWRYEPPTRDGEPVSVVDFIVQVGFEVS
ncbi:hypothetical protein ABI59_16735 [Acidobacteria bacterium Mor1]|nr:hypothetical protein ABI59_16735 [Acidobacteria bacterium Mor1]